jgi:hypothetical protein
VDVGDDGVDVAGTSVGVGDADAVGGGTPVAVAPACGTCTTALVGVGVAPITTCRTAPWAGMAAIHTATKRMPAIRMMVFFLRTSSSVVNMAYPLAFGVFLTMALACSIQLSGSSFCQFLD